jgi:hypothetical protein
VGALLGEQAAGGNETLQRARERLERAHWRQALHEPEVAFPVAETPA